MTTAPDPASDARLWPSDFPLDDDDQPAEGLVVWSRLKIIEGRTTGSRQACRTTGCPGWLLGVNWESEHDTRYPCSKGWTFDAATGTVSISDGGEISARAFGTAPPSTNPTPRWEWPERSSLATRAGWRITGVSPPTAP